MQCADAFRVHTALSVETAFKVHTEIVLEDNKQGSSQCVTHTHTHTHTKEEEERRAGCDDLALVARCLENSKLENRILCDDTTP